MKLNEMNEASLGSAIMSKLGQKLNPFNRSGASNLSLQDRMVQQQFVKDLVGRTATNISMGIKNGLIDPNTKAPTEPIKPVNIGSNVKPTPAEQEPVKIGGQKLDPKNPADKKIIDRVNAQQSTGQGSSAASTAPAASTTPPAAPKTPEQIRIEKQKAAAAQAQSQMKPKPVAPAAPDTPAPKTPEQIRIEKQKAAAAQAQSQMKPKINSRAAGAASRARLKQRNPKRIKEENQYEQLDAIFESIVAIDEVTKTYPYTISTFLQEFLKQYLGGIDVSALKPQMDQVQASFKLGGGRKALEKLAGAAYSLYSTGGAGTADSAKAATGQTTPATTAAGSSLANMISGNSTAAPNTASPANTGTATTPPSTDTTPTPPTAPATPASPEKVKTVYMQVKDLVNKLDKKGKQRILSTLQKEIGTASPVANPPPPPSNVTNISQAKSKRTKSTPSNVVPLKRTKKRVAESKTFRVWGEK